VGVTGEMGKSPAMDAPLWNISDACRLEPGKKVASGPLYMNVG